MLDVVVVALVGFFNAALMLCCCCSYSIICYIPANVCVCLYVSLACRQHFKYCFVFLVCRKCSWFANFSVEYFLIMFFARKTGKEIQKVSVVEEINIERVRGSPNMKWNKYWNINKDSWIIVVMRMGYGKKSQTLKEIAKRKKQMTKI